MFKSPALIKAFLTAALLISSCTDHESPTQDTQTSENISDLSTPFTVAAAALANHKGLFIGEMHGQLAIYEWLTDHLDDFKQQGVAQLYMEAIRSEDQYLIDDYYNGVIDADIKLYNYIEERIGHHSAGTGMACFNIIKIAKENGIKVYGVDEGKKIYSWQNIFKLGRVPDMFGKERLERSNPHWSDVIDDRKRELGKNKKFLILGGASHSHADKGVDALQGNIPSMDFLSVGTGGEKITKSDGIRSDYDVILPRSPHQRAKDQLPAEIYRFKTSASL